MAESRGPSDLLGDWAVEFLFPNPLGLLSGKVSFQSLDGGSLIRMRSVPAADGPPVSTAVIGKDDRSGGYSMLYWDERGVSRIYEMSWDAGSWTLFCRTSQFLQRFDGRLSDGGETLSGAWWKSDDGRRWDLDFKLSYKRE